MRAAVLLAAVLALPAALPGAARGEGITVTHALTIAGAPGLPPGFSHFPYVNPAAPKGGELRLHAVGTFDTTNPFSSKGDLPAGFGLLHDSLTTPARDEPGTDYCLVAQRIRYPDDRSWIEFDINPAARFHDGSPITAHDVVFSYEATMSNIGSVLQRFFADILSVRAVGERCVRFTFAPGASREIPQYVGRLYIYPASFWKGRDLGRTALEVVPGSGPYRLRSFRQGREVVYERVRDYWAADLPVCRGRFNFDIVRYEYFRDATVAQEAFRAGHYDLREEHSAKNWHTLYTGPAFDRGEIVRESLPHGRDLGIQGFFFNTRRPMFADIRVRRAIVLALDYEWINRQFFWNEQLRTTSYFTNTELACSGVPRGRELELLEPFRDRLPRELFERPHAFPVSQADGHNRDNLLRAARLLDEAGYRVRDGLRRHPQTGLPLRFQLLTDSAAVRRLAVSFAGNLRRLGIGLHVFVADTPTFMRKKSDFDFDMVSAFFGHGRHPGQELRFFWHSMSRDMPDSPNLAGIADPAVDALVEAILAAREREETVAACRALDRVLLWGEYVVPLGASGVDRVAYRRGIEHPRAGRSSFVDINAWWASPDQGHSRGTQ